MILSQMYQILPTSLCFSHHGEFSFYKALGFIWAQIGIFERCTRDLFYVPENCAFANSTDKNFVRLRLITIKIQYVTSGYTFQRNISNIISGEKNNVAKINIFHNS